MYLPLACWFLAESLPEVVSMISGVSEVYILLFCVDFSCLCVCLFIVCISLPLLQHVIFSSSLHTMKVC